MRKYYRDYYLKNREKKKEQAKSRYYLNPEPTKRNTRDRYRRLRKELKVYHTKKHLQAKYLMSWERFVELRDLQGNRCAICKEEEPRKGWRLSVDHDHQTGKVRGLLCSKCNTGLGQFKDSLALIRSVIAYLEFHSELRTPPQ